MAVKKTEEQTQEQPTAQTAAAPEGQAQDVPAQTDAQDAQPAVEPEAIEEHEQDPQTAVIAGGEAVLTAGTREELEQKAAQLAEAAAGQGIQTAAGAVAYDRWRRLWIVRITRTN